MRFRTAAAALAAIALATSTLSGCSPATPTAAPVPTEVAIGATPWPHGTVGQYGLRIDPTLLAKLPRYVAAMPVREDARTEIVALDDTELPKSLDAYAAAAVGEISDTDWLNVAIVHLNSAAQTPDFLESWQTDYATGACSQADGVAGNNQEQINDWLVDVSTCAGGPVVYTLSLGNGVILSMYGLGSKDLGRKLIEALY